MQGVILMRIDRKNQFQVNINVDWFFLEKMQLIFMAKKTDSESLPSNFLKER